MTNAQQFKVFMRDYQNMVFSTAMRLLADHAEAEDVAQEVFLESIRTVRSNCATARPPVAGSKPWPPIFV
jgi:DNA-directed RNA polymerase specialized sigma24 family protein